MALSFNDTVIPPGLLAKVLDEMDNGVRLTVQQSSTLFRSSRMTLDDFLSLLRSFAWQSPTLKAWLEESGQSSKKRRPVPDESLEVLTLEDIQFLTQGYQDSSKRSRQQDAKDAAESCSRFDKLTIYDPCFEEEDWNTNFPEVNAVNERMTARRTRCFSSDGTCSGDSDEERERGVVY
jgi:hypothetical protein